MEKEMENCTKYYGIVLDENQYKNSGLSFRAPVVGSTAQGLSWSAYEEKQRSSQTYP